MMKKINLLLIPFTIIILLFVFNGCNKKDNSTNSSIKTTGHLYAKLKINQRQRILNVDPICIDTTQPFLDVIIILDEGGTTLKVLNTSNNTITDLGELNPGNYLVYGKCKRKLLNNNSPYGCHGQMGNIEMNGVIVQIVANQDQTITVDR